MAAPVYYIPKTQAEGLPEPNSHHIPYHLMAIWTVSVVVLVYSLRWAVLKITDMTDPKGPQRRVRKPGEKPGRWEDRGLERVWFWYYVLHIPITLCLDAQSIFPQHIIPAPLRDFNAWYKVWSRDPIINGAGTGAREWAWLDVFLHAEVGVQVPCFVVGAWWLYKNDKRAYPLTLIYASHTATTLLPVIYYILTHNSYLSTSSPSSSSALSAPLDALEIASLLGSYLPFLLIPLGMIVHMMTKLNGLIKKAERVEVLEQAEAREVVDIETKKRK